MKHTVVAVFSALMFSIVALGILAVESPIARAASLDTDCDGMNDSVDSVDNRFGMGPAETAAQNRSAFIAAVEADRALHLCGGATDAEDRFPIANDTMISVAGATGSVTMVDGAYLEYTTDGQGVRFIDGGPVTLNNWNSVGKMGYAVGAPNLTLNNMTGAKLYSPRTYGGPGAGIIFYGGADPVVRDAVVRNSGRDGLHFANTANARVYGYDAYETGDDALAFLNYESKPDRTGGYATDVHVRDSTKARSITVVGQRNVTVENFTVNRSHGSAVYVMEEDNPAYRTREPSNVHFRNGCVKDAGQLRKGGRYGSHRHSVFYGGVSSGVTFENIKSVNPGGKHIQKRSLAGEDLNLDSEKTDVRPVKRC